MSNRYREIQEKNYVKTIYFPWEDNADLIEWLQQQENASDAVRQALRQHLQTPPLSRGGQGGCPRANTARCRR